MRIRIAALLGSLPFILTKHEFGPLPELTTLSDTTTTTSDDEDDENRNSSAVVEECQGFDPPIRNEEYLSDFQVHVISEHLTDSYRNISVDLELTQYLHKNPLLHFYVTDMAMYSYQCENRDSCTYKLCDPETPQEVKLTKKWNGRCPLAPGKYHYDFFYSLKDALSRQIVGFHMRDEQASQSPRWLGSPKLKKGDLVSGPINAAMKALFNRCNVHKVLMGYK
ncbi:hypothetical protein MTO96_018586 [Rhipicephalus appendiculatus]